MNNAIISVQMQGGLGNMMFQAAFAMAFSFENNCDYELLNFHENCFLNKQWLNRNANYYADLVFNRFDLSVKFGDTIIHPESTFHYSAQPFIQGKKNIYKGYFQSEKYFYSFKDQIKSIFQPSGPVLNQIYSKYSFDFSEYISIHIRRGDYVSQPNNHPVVSLKYLHNAISSFAVNSKFLVFSDDVEWCKQNLSEYSNLTYISDELDYVSMYMMSLCSNHILSNSSFSWWSAWLNRREDKIVIRPDVWFGTNYSHLNTNDLCPKDWLVLGG